MAISLQTAKVSWACRGDGEDGEEDMKEVASSVNDGSLDLHLQKCIYFSDYQIQTSYVDARLAYEFAKKCNDKNKNISHFGFFSQNKATGKKRTLKNFLNAVGSRLARETEYTDSILDNERAILSEVVMQTLPDDYGDEEDDDYDDSEDDDGQNVCGLEGCGGSPANVRMVQRLLYHLDVMKAATSAFVNVNNIKWNFYDMCHAQRFPNVDDDHEIDKILDGLQTCVIVTPLDCFWEGSKLLGPQDPVKIPNFGSIEFKWTNLNPRMLVNGLRTFSSLSAKYFKELMDKAGVTSGYQEKPCLNPFDEECPTTAPNYASKKLPDVMSLLSSGCSGISSKYMRWNVNFLLGGVTWNDTQHLTSQYNSLR
ncbi:hypothetical protein HELRODRAFT_189874 [Helobdella robusta]|uniref:Uncharacterized protein n=1 Tax=Helobdella robusta TaxID=6412 RepID=T1FRF7_HELRO|nr:hypothetical protein HELRODRAFT_189874 [Helobdella robusta]ESN90493.1 hypothetical protein HELRODRAFT_189874 [Helobdella robusta]